jgi:hypothetical protein
MAKEILNPNCSEVIFRLYTGNKKEDTMKDNNENAPIISISDWDMVGDFKSTYKYFVELKKKNKTLKNVNWKLIDNYSNYLDEDIADEIVRYAYEVANGKRKMKPTLTTINKFTKEVWGEQK